MKKLLLLTFFCFMTKLAFAHGGHDLIIHGYIICNKCAQAHKNELNEKVKTHNKECLLKSACMGSGYSIYSLDDGQVYKFDDDSNKEVAGFLKNSGNRTDVVIIAEKHGETLMIESIKNRRIVR